MALTAVEQLTALLNENPDVPIFVYHETIKQIRAEVENGGGGSEDGGTGMRVVTDNFNGTRKDYDPPGGIDAVDVLVIDTFIKLWKSHTLYSPYQVGPTNISNSAVKRTASPDCYFTAYFCAGVSGSGEPEWPDTINGQYIHDGSVIWYPTTNYIPLEWTPGASVTNTGGSFIFGNYVWSVTTDGNTGLVEPNWNNSPNPGDQINDGTAVWTNIAPYLGRWTPETKYGPPVVYTDNSSYVLPLLLPSDESSAIFMEFEGGTDLNYSKSGATEPDWDDIVPESGYYVNDGTILWAETTSQIDSLSKSMLTGIKAPSDKKFITLVMGPRQEGDLGNDTLTLKDVNNIDEDVIASLSSEDANRILNDGEDQDIGSGYFLGLYYDGEYWSYVVGNV